VVQLGNAGLYLGARPVFCDIDPGTLAITPATVLAKLTPKTKAVVVVHYEDWRSEVECDQGALPKGVG